MEQEKLNTSADSRLSGTRVACVLWGTLRFRGRLLKQIDTLTEAGAECRLIYAACDEEPDETGSFPFPIAFHRATWNAHPLLTFFRQIRFCRTAAEDIARSDATHALCFSIQTILAGTLAKRRNPALKVVYDSNELCVEHFIHPLKRFLWRLVQKFCIPQCDSIIHAERNRLDYFIRNHDPKAAPGKHSLLENLPAFIPPGKLREKPDQPPTRVLYVGVMGADRYSKELIDIFRELGSDYSLDLVGPCTEAFRSELDEKLVGASNVRVLPPIPYKEMSNLIQNYHVGIALYRNDNINNYLCAPNKVYDYLMNRVAVISNDYPGLLEVVEKDRVGACVSGIGTSEFKRALELIAREDRRRNISESLRARYSWENQKPGYLAIFSATG